MTHTPDPTAVEIAALKARLRELRAGERARKPRADPSAYTPEEHRVAFFHRDGVTPRGTPYTPIRARKELALFQKTEDKERARALLVSDARRLASEGHTAREIGDLLSVTKGVVIGLAHREGIELLGRRRATGLNCRRLDQSPASWTPPDTRSRFRTRTRKNKPEDAPTPIDVAVFRLRELAAEGKSLNEMADATGMSWRQAQYYCHKHGIDIRPPSDYLKKADWESQEPEGHKLEDIPRLGCRWPVWPPSIYSRAGASHTRFCGEPVAVERWTRDHCWCPQHARLGIVRRSSQK